jgi:hypothetical protein
VLQKLISIQTNPILT